MISILGGSIKKLLEKGSIIQIKNNQLSFDSWLWSEGIEDSFSLSDEEYDNKYDSYLSFCKKFGYQIPDEGWSYEDQLNWDLMEYNNNLN